jgi:hypothetical protein
MKEGIQKSKYCFDTDTLAASWRRYYRPSSFEALWDRLGDMMKRSIILIPEEVKKEIGAGKDELVTWMKRYCPRCVAIDDAQLRIVSQIVNKYPAVSQYKKPRPNHADPFVVAVAKIHGLEVVTFEKTKNASTVNPAIPDLCAEYGVTCCAMPDFFEKEGISFELK